MQKAIKRSLDICSALIGLILLSPVLIAVAAWIRCTMGTPIFFRQQRPGLDGKPFVMLKFRTMTDSRDENGELFPDGQRLTRLGRFLRKSSIDEFPELVNVLRGEMSLVGPRPLLMEYLERYTPEQARRHDVRPGITGWAQVNGRQDLLFSKRFEFDVWYVDNYSFGLDAKIIAMTLCQAFFGRGVQNAQDVSDVDDLGFNCPK